MKMRTRGKMRAEGGKLLDLRVFLLKDDAALLRALIEDAKRNERSMPSQIRFVLKQWFLQQSVKDL